MSGAASSAHGFCFLGKEERPEVKIYADSQAETNGLGLEKNRIRVRKIRLSGVETCGKTYGRDTEFEEFCIISPCQPEIISYCRITE